MKTSFTQTCCVECFSYEGIQKKIQGFDRKGECDYCGSKGVHIGSVAEVGKFILGCFHKKYEDAAESVSHDSTEGGYQLPTDLIDEILLNEIQVLSDGVTHPGELLEDLVHPDGTPYVRKDPYGPLSGGEDLIEIWEAFKETIRDHRRFTIFLRERPAFSSDKHIPTFLEDLVNLLASDHVVSLPKGTQIYRGRVLGKGWSPSHEELTSPPRTNTTNNRMSPKGVSLFYGALNLQTVIAEARPHIGSSIAIAPFQLLRQLTLIDLSREIKVHDIFDSEYDFFKDEYYRPFLKEFLESISIPLGPSDPEIDYLPTQVLTEYLRFHPKHKFDGILYRSTQMKGGVNVVLFKEDNISSQDIGNKKAWIHFSGFEVHEIGGIEYISHRISKSQ